MSKARFAAALAVSILAGGCRQAHAASDKVGFSGLEKQLAPESQRVRGKISGPLGRVSVLVTIGTDGKVIDAQILRDDQYDADPAPALALARTWRFRPPTFEGKPVVAVGTVPIYYNPPEDRPDPKAAVPASAPEDTEVTLARTACYGTCPDYQVSVRGDGLVRFDNRHEGRGTVGDVHLEYNGNWVLIPGHHEARIDPAAAQALIARFRTIGFFGLKPAYIAGMTDQPTQFLIYRAGNTIRKLADYAGESVGMPDAVGQLEAEVDKVSGSARWVDGNVDTVTWLAAQGFDFRSATARKLAVAALDKVGRYARGDDVPRVYAMIMAMADRGLPLEADGIGAGLTKLVAMNGYESLFEGLRQKGLVARMKKADINEAFGQGAGCSAPIAQALAAAGADPRSKGSWDGNALQAINGGSSSPCEGKEPARIAEAARALIELHVPLEARSGIGWTPLMGTEYPEVAAALIAHGANINARDHDGNTPLLATDDDRVALLLLRAGADPRARNKEGTIRAHAIRDHMPATLAWLDAHDIP